MINIKNDNNSDLKNQVHDKLCKYNRQKCEWLKENAPIASEREYSNFIAFDNDDLIGGAIGYIEYNWYFIDLLCVDEKYRRKRVGTKLMNAIEKFSKEKCLKGIRTSTWDFQAREFYEKIGYSIFGEIKDCPPGAVEYYLKKEI